MRAVTTVVVAGLLAAAAPAAAQFQKVEKAPQTWVSAWVGGLHDPAVVSDDGSDSLWQFGTALGGGLGVHRRVGQTLVVGVDATYAPARFERTTPRTNGTKTEGTASISTALATARLLYGGSDALGMYLTGGIGALAYGMPEDAGGRDIDPAVLAGAGIEYKLSTHKSVYVEWGRYWTFHQHEGVQSNTAKHGALRLGGRLGR